MTGGKSLPSPLQLTGDSRWDKCGDLFAAYDLQLGDGGGDGGQADVESESVVDAENVAIDDVDAHGNGTTAVKVLSGKSNDEIKKMLETFRENQKEYNPDDPEVINLYNEFKELMIPDRHRLVN